MGDALTLAGVFLQAMHVVVKRTLDALGPEFEAQVLEKNSREADLLIKKGYKIKKSVWNGLIAS